MKELPNWPHGKAHGPWIEKQPASHEIDELDAESWTSRRAEVVDDVFTKSSRRKEPYRPNRDAKRSIGRSMCDIGSKQHVPTILETDVTDVLHKTYSTVSLSKI